MSIFSKSEDDKELIEQLKILNTLIFLDSQYQHTDSIMSMKEIQEAYIAIGRKVIKENINELM